MVKDLDKVEKLDNSFQYPAWLKTVKEKLGMAGLARFLPEGSQAKAPTRSEGEAADIFSARTERWQEKNEIGRYTILSLLTNNAKNRVASTEKRPVNTVAELWKAITAEFTPKGKVLFSHYMRQWNEASKESCGGITEFSAELRRIQSEMSDLDSKSAWPDSHLIVKFLDGLGPEFDLWITTWEPHNSPINEYGPEETITKAAVTLDEATEAALQFESSEKLRKSANASFMATRAGATLLSHGVKRKAPKCSHCKLIGHEEGGCFVLHPELKPEGWDAAQVERRQKRARIRAGKGSNTSTSVNIGTLAAAPAPETSIPFRNRHLISFSLTASTKLPKAAEPGLCSRMFKGMSKPREAATSSGSLDNIPKDSRTGQALAALGLVAARNKDAAKVAEQLRTCVVLDSGASCHTFVDKEGFINLRDAVCSPTIGIGGKVILPKQKGSYVLSCLIEGRHETVTLTDVTYSPEVGANLISVSQLVNKGAEFLFRSDGGYGSIGSDIFMTTQESHGLYIVDQPTNSKFKSGINVTLAAYSVVDPTLKIWHERLGHISESSLKQLVEKSGLPPARDTSCVCEICVRSRMKQTPHTGTLKKGTYPLESLHVDIAGMPMGCKGYDGTAQYALVTCDFTKITWVLLLKSKAEFPRAFRSFLQEIERPERRCHIITLDQAGENTSKDFELLCLDRGIALYLTATDQHEQGGIIERAIGTHKGIFRPMLLQAQEAGIPMKYWPIIAQTANYCQIRMPSTALDGKTPYQAWYGSTPTWDHMVTVGTPGRYLEPRTKHSVFEDKTLPCKMLGYQNQSTHNYVILLDSGRVCHANNVQWREKHVHIPSKDSPDTTDRNKRRWGNIPESEGGSLPPAPKRVKQAAPSGVTRSNSATGGESQEHSDDYLVIPTDFDELPRGRMLPDDEDASSSDSSTIQTPDESSSTVDTTTDDDSNRDSSRTITPVGDNITVAPTTVTHPTPDPEPFATVRTLPERNIPELRPRNDSLRPANYRFRLNLAFNLMVATAGAILIATEILEPKSLNQAKYSPQWLQWYKAMGSEHKSLVDNRTWKLCQLPKGRRALTGKWVYKVKTNQDGEVERYKARWVVRGFEQTDGVDFNETFASVVKPMSYKVLFAIAAALDLEVHQMDVKTAFLYGSVNEEIYVQQPPEFDDGTDNVCKLNKALYGLKQAPRIWYETLASFLKTLGFENLDADVGVFARGNCYIAVYVDDLLIVGPTITEINDIKDALKTKFQMSDLGEVSYYLGMSVRRNRATRTIYLSQRAYLEKILRDFDMWDGNKAEHQQARPVYTPMVDNLEAPAENFVADAADIHWYQRAIGSLMYAMLGTRPDIAFAVSKCSRYLARPNKDCIRAVQRIFAYLRTTIDLELVYRGDSINLQGFSDADWAGDRETRRSTSGYIFNLGSGAVSWSSKRQPTVSLSSCESELKGQTQATKEAIWLRRLLKELNASKNDIPTIIYGDNQGALALAHNPEFHSRSKHLQTQDFFCREQQQAGQVDFKYVNTKDQVADGLTKALGRPEFERFRASIGLERNYIIIQALSTPSVMGEAKGRNPRAILVETRAENEERLRTAKPARMPIHENTTGFLFSRYLQQFNQGGISSLIQDPKVQGSKVQGLRTASNQPYVHHRCVSFSTSQQRSKILRRCGKEWENDIASRDTFTEFWNAPKTGRCSWICMVATPQNGLHNGLDIDTEIWHACAILILKDQGGGKSFVLWDCDPTHGVDHHTRAKTAATGYQRMFLDTAISRSKDIRIWYNIDRSLSGQGRCVQYSMEKVHEWYTYGDTPYLGLEDPRLDGCIELGCR
ncbi:putative Integrase catalytic domain-containing protein [Seiridium cardinale]|uniref:Integrase catalytic domain-containing protein n=1 Tax=Seiridium cardinale TaxID=138064 RepID=A0ABR2X653_9PEZI